MPALRYAKLAARFQRQNLLSLDELCEVIKAHDISPGPPSYQLTEEGRIFEYEMTVRTQDANNLRYLAETLSKMEQIKEFSIIPTGD